MTTITVTAEDIAQGVRDDCQACPIARAGERAGLARISVGHHFLYWGPNESRSKAEMPLSARHFILDYDVGSPVEPFSFEVET